MKVQSAGDSPGAVGASLQEDIIVEENTANNLRFENKNDMKSTNHEAFS